MDVLLHLRRADVEWFQSSPEHKKELFHLLSQHIIPKECEQEIEQYHDKRDHRRPRPSEIGEKNKQRGKKGGKKRKGAPEPEGKEKPQREIRHVFGDDMQVTYRAEQMKQNESATLIFPKKTDESKPSMFRQLPKLSKRIVLWCYPREIEDSDSPPTGGGFPRPEMLPISSLFRTPSAESD